VGQFFSGARVNYSPALTFFLMSKSCRFFPPGPFLW
jgi:hypothetical protein